MSFRSGPKSPSASGSIRHTTSRDHTPKAVAARNCRAGRLHDPETEAARVQARLRKVENQFDRFRAQEFWDRVMQEIADLLVERGLLTPTEILPELRAVTLRGATLHKEPLTPGTFKKKMDVRVFHGRYFVSRDEGRYARKAG